MRSAINSMQSYRLAASEPVVAIAVAPCFRALCDAGEVFTLRHRNQEHARFLGNECKLLACFPFAGVAHRLGDRNLEFCRERRSIGHGSYRCLIDQAFVRNSTSRAPSEVLC